MIKRIKEVAEDTQYYTKSLTKGAIKINCSTPETYRKMVRSRTITYTTIHISSKKTERIE
jgi:hypothetical protein